MGKRKTAPQEPRAIILQPDKLAKVVEDHQDTTPQQRELVDIIVSRGCTVTQAAEIMGKHRAWASHTLQKPHVQAYANDLARSLLGVAGLQALVTASQLLSTARSERVKAELAQDLMNRAQVGTQERSVGTSVEVNIDLG